MKTLLKRIIDQDLKVAIENQKLIDLKNKFIKENRKFKKGYFVSFNDFNKTKIGRIGMASYKDGQVQYCIHVVTKTGSYSKSDKAFYYKFEKDITPYPVLNAMNNL